MTPYYDDGTCTIWHGDCRDVLPQLDRVDLVLTDPPYGVGVDYGDGIDDTPQVVAEIAGEILPLMRAAAPTVLLTPGVANVHAYQQPTWILAWIGDDGWPGGCRWGFPNWQPILAYGPDPYLARGLGRRQDVIRTSLGKKPWKEQKSIDHPCPKPLDFWKRLMVRGSPAEGETILDPFLGSGTTLRAAKDLGRRAVGIEKSERYCEVAAKRLAQEVLDFGNAS